MSIFSSLSKVKVEVMNWLFLDCEQAARLVNLRTHKSISFVKRFQLAVHLLLCIDCKNYQEEIGWLDNNVESYKELNADAPMYTLSSKAKERMKESLHELENHL